MDREKLAKSMFNPFTSFQVDGSLADFLSWSTPPCVDEVVKSMPPPNVWPGASIGESIKALGLG